MEKPVASREKTRLPAMKVVKLAPTNLNGRLHGALLLCCMIYLEL